MTWTIPTLVIAGLLLSAFFSGSETGFYRAGRLRLLLDALAGDRIARGLHWLTKHPAIFVATTLVGNNLANYMTTLAIVMGTHAVVVGVHTTGAGGSPSAVLLAELIAPLILAPVLFVYGELLPKRLFLQAPNRLLRRGGPLFFVFVVLFFPISMLLWALNWLLTVLGGQSPEQVHSTLARRELQRALDEGHEAGILHPAQRQLTQGIFAGAQQPLKRFITPMNRLPRARSNMSRQEVQRLARRFRISAVPVESATDEATLVGYVRVIDLGLDDAAEIGPLRRLLEIPEDTSQLDALMQMQSAKEGIARVTDAKGTTLGIVTATRLREPLFRGG